MRRAMTEAWGRVVGFDAHSEDESVSLDDLERSCVAEALFFGYLAGR